MVLYMILGVLAVAIAGFALFLWIGLGLKDVSVKNIDISKVPDGIFTGKLTGSRFRNTLKVTVNAGKVTDIQIVKDMKVVLPDISSKVFGEVLEKQSLQVDCVSKATATSKAYLKSLENALEGK